MSISVVVESGNRVDGEYHRTTTSSGESDTTEINSIDPFSTIVVSSSFSSEVEETGNSIDGDFESTATDEDDVELAEDFSLHGLTVSIERQFNNDEYNYFFR